jgi:hypothetical protein
MQQLASVWHALTFGRRRQLIALRVLTLLTFVGAGVSLVARELHHAVIADFCGGLAVGVSASLLFIVFSIQSAEFKDTADEDGPTELKLSR